MLFLINKMYMIQHILSQNHRIVLHFSLLFLTTSSQSNWKSKTFRWMPTWMNADVVSRMHCGSVWVLPRKHPTQQMWKHVKSSSFTFKLYVKVNLCAWVRPHSRLSSAWKVNVNSALYNDKLSARTIHFEAQLSLHCIGKVKS